ncbi:MAG: hypothetical protein ACOY3L_07365 [Pseudomonadota bacterium]
MDYSLVIPARNEADNLPPLLAAIVAQVDRFNDSNGTWERLALHEAEP